MYTLIDGSMEDEEWGKLWEETLLANSQNSTVDVAVLVFRRTAKWRRRTAAPAVRQGHDHGQRPTARAGPAPVPV